MKAGARRALAADSLKPHEIAARIRLSDPWEYFTAKVEGTGRFRQRSGLLTFPSNCEERGVTLRWKRDELDEKLRDLYRKALATFGSGREQGGSVSGPEEVGPELALRPGLGPQSIATMTTSGVNDRRSGRAVGPIARYGHRPRVGDTFSGGGHPFEAARIGCDAYASDLNPIARMLTLGRIEHRLQPHHASIEKAQKQLPNW